MEKTSKPQKIKPESLEQSIFRKNLEKRIAKIEGHRDYIDCLPCQKCSRDLIPVFVIQGLVIRKACLMCGFL